jgi:osmotically-inducible protein OsmY
MITSVISSAARLSLAPARLAGRMAGSLLSGLRGDAAEDAQPAPSSARTKTASRRRAQAQPKRAASRRRAKAQPKRAASRRRTQAQPKRAARDKPLDDVTIARNVESTIFQGVEIDKGELDVNVADGVVRLRGEVRTPDLISELETRAARVSEVRRVENLLHLPKPPAPGRAAAPARQSETSGSAAPTDDRAVSLGETSEQVPAPPSALRTRDFAAAGTEPGPAPAASAGEGADPADGRPAGDETTEQEGPDVAELDKDQADQPSDPGLRDLKGG